MGTYVHLMWSCPKTQLYWEKICVTICRVVNTNVKLSPLQCILGLPVEDPKIRQYAKLISSLLYSARLTLLQHWLSDTVPTDSNWLDNVFQMLPLERLSYVLQGNINYFFQIWKPLMVYIGEDAAKILEKGFTVM